MNRYKNMYTGEIILEQAYLAPLVLYGKDAFENITQTYKYLKEWNDWFYQ